MWWLADDDDEEETEYTEAWSKVPQHQHFLAADALEDADARVVGMDDVERSLAQTVFVEVDEDLYSNIMLSMLNPDDNVATRFASVSLILLAACLQCVLAFAIFAHVTRGMSWSSVSIRANTMLEIYTGLKNDGKLEYIRLDMADSVDLCGEFNDAVTDERLLGTNWSAYYEYSKVPINSWQPWDIPPTDRSELDTARFVLENAQYAQVYMIVTFMWGLTVCNCLRLLGLYLMAVVQTPLTQDPDDQVLRQDGDEFQILMFTTAAKRMCLACGAYRIFINVVISFLGYQFLLWTSTNVELIFNALALTFILELDRIIYKAIVSSARQNLIRNLRQLAYHDTRLFSFRRMNNMKTVMMFTVISVCALGTYLLRLLQRAAYMKMFTLIAAICLFQGPTPNYWTKFRSNFPTPGLCESVLQLKCEAPIVGEDGRPCVEDWHQTLCQFYMKADSLFSTWDSINWDSTGACVSYFPDTWVPHSIADLDIPDDGTTLSILASACKAMWQQRPLVHFRGRARETTGPRLRVYPYRNYLPAAPFWCAYEGGADGVLLDEEPAGVDEWPQLLQPCAGSALIYTGGVNGRPGRAQGGGMASNQSWMKSKGLDKIEQANGPFSGVWLSPNMGVVVIANRGSEAELTSPLLPASPVPASVTDNTIKMLRRPFWSGELKDGQIHLSNGDILVNQMTELEKAQTQSTTSPKPPPPPKIFFFIR